MPEIYTAEELKLLLAPVFLAYAVARAVLFGSYARGEATRRSDVDIMVDSRGGLLNIRFYGLLEELTGRLKKPVDLIEAAEIHPGSPMEQTIAREGVVLYEAER